MTTFRVSATTHLLNYLPEYIAAEQGFFTEAGLDVTNTPRIPWDLVLDDLAEGKAEAALGGIWVPAMLHRRGRELKAFAQIANRAPFSLIGRTSSPFNWPDLRGKTVACVGSTGASVAIFFKFVMTENGVDPREVNFIQDLDTGILATTFRGGMADYFVTDDLTAEILARQDDLHICCRFVEEGGDVPWSVYYADAEAPVTSEAQDRFSGAIDKAIAWINGRGASTFSAILTKLFPASPPDLMVSVVNRYRNNSMWTSSAIPVASYERWQRGIHQGHLIDAPLAYDALVLAKSKSEGK